MSNIVEKRRLLNINEVAGILGLSVKTIYNQISEGRFPIKVKKVGKAVRFDSDDVQEYLDYGKK